MDMDNAAQPAFPFFIPPHEDYYGNQQAGGTYEGLTKREEFAKTAMYALLSNPSITTERLQNFAEDAVKMADALLSELDKEK